MTVTEAARTLGYSRVWVYELLTRGVLWRDESGKVDRESVMLYVAGREGVTA